MGAEVSLCPPPRQLERLLAEELGGPERDSVEAHVERCSSCQDQLTRLVGTPPAPSGSRAGGRPGGATPEPAGDFLDRLKQPPRDEAHPPASVADWLENGRLGQYEILGKLGKGGMGAVYKARHVELGKVVALKVLPAAQVCEANVARFKHEVRAIGRLEHPNIVAAYDAGEHRGVRYLVMALVDGIDLERLVDRRGPLPVADACELARQAAAGLQHAFEQGLVHRDVKPHNLMLARDGAVKVLDMGLARSFADATAETLTASGTMLGTADYLAPEQWDSPHAADTRADIYGLGCTLYHLVAGHPPFEKYRSVLRKMEAHQRVPPPPITGPRPDAPAELAAVLDRMLAKDPADRFASPAEVVEALMPLAAGADLGRLIEAAGAAAASPASPAAVTPGPAALKTTQSRRDRPSARRYALPVAAAVVGLAALAVSLLWPGSGGTPGGGPAPGPAPAAQPLAVKEMHVIHYQDNGAKRLGNLRTSTQAVKLDDNVEVTVELSAPAHCYLIAFNPEGGEGGTEQLCYPESADGKGEKTIPPDKVKEFRYPRKIAFVLDAAGLQVFVLAASTKPLPPYEEWRSQPNVTPPWKGGKDGGKDRWHFDGREFTLLTPDRARLEPLKGAPEPMRKLCDWFKGRSEFEVVQAFAFPVAKK
jgi:hypothetical protein